ncbi:P27 family phage terminase small subunit [Marininema halotolerans]|uniref:Phage terminase, small subunit, putative, P27 family n=1 Tax=Marininema halotolerans TaxID=1155944 RepID=A0A1I6URY2_9BACL|nr:P27 family phage terminase small subunit [Marininema halotolerans]SFT04186.1 hypothetical protein SAMN05444972_11946 [Marininema halotolerans]
MDRYKPKSIIKRKAAKDMFQILVQELQKCDALNDRTIMLVDNMVLLEQIKQGLLDDLKERGIVELFINGSQEMYRDNKSADKVLKVVEQQRKLQAELRLSPASDKQISEAVTMDEFEEF